MKTVYPVKQSGKPGQSATQQPLCHSPIFGYQFPSPSKSLEPQNLVCIFQNLDIWCPDTKRFDVLCAHLIFLQVVTIL